MKCLVFSDSHGSSMLMKRALDMHRDAEVVFFLGDGLSDAYSLSSLDKSRFWICVKGNCDVGSDAYFQNVKKVETVNLMEYTITLTHGDLYGAKYGNGGLLSLAKETKADILLYGHTHCPKCDYFSDTEPSLYLFNPGSISLRSGSYGILTLGKAPFFSHGAFV